MQKGGTYYGIHRKIFADHLYCSCRRSSMSVYGYQYAGCSHLESLPQSEISYFHLGLIKQTSQIPEVYLISVLRHDYKDKAQKHFSSAPFLFCNDSAFCSGFCRLNFCTGSLCPRFCRLSFCTGALCPCFRRLSFCT